MKGIDATFKARRVRAGTRRPEFPPMRPHERQNVPNACMARAVLQRRLLVDLGYEQPTTRNLALLPAAVFYRLCDLERAGTLTTDDLRSACAEAPRPLDVAAE